MPAWCTTDEVDALVSASPPLELLQEYADYATSVLFAMSGRAYKGESTVAARFQVTSRGRIRLVTWAPVRSIVSAVIDGTSDAVALELSPAGTYATVPRVAYGKMLLVTMGVGQNPPPSGKRAAAHFAAELLREDPRYKALDGASDGRASSRITSIARQGVTYTFADPAALAQANLTGVLAVDSFLRAVNPTGARYQTKVVTTS